MARTITLNTCHLYPDLMDTYGDKGNIITLVKRCQWRGIDVKVTNISLGQSLSTYDFDLYFFGGGQDRAQFTVGPDLEKKAFNLKKAIEDGAVLLSICGGYQLLQKYFKTKEGKIIKGIGLFDAYTLGSDTRMIQNLLVEINPELQAEINNVYLSTHMSLRGASRRSNLIINQDRHAPLAVTRGIGNLVGFENHSGKTYLNSSLQPLGLVLKGAGNNGEDHTEGAVYKNAFGCYLHGSLLPKNPHFADYLISKALARRYGIVKLEPLDDSIEWQAHRSAVKTTRSQT